jgi:PAS domain S-box-containing protein
MTDAPRPERRLRSRRLEDLERDNLFALSLDLLAVCGFDGVFRQVNPAFTRVLGYTMEELTTRPFIELVLSEDLPATVVEFRRVTEGGNVVTFENRWRHADGSTRWLQWNATSDVERQVIYATARDVTERRRAEAELARLASIVEHSDDAIVGVSLGGVIETWNAAAETIFGWRAAEVRDKPLSILVPAGHADHHEQVLDQIRRGQKVMHYETIRRRKDGAVINVSLTVSAVRDMAGQVAGASLILRDITERKVAEKERLNLLQQLEHTLARSKRLTGTVHFCEVCKRVRTPGGNWVDVARYLDDHSDASPIPGRCPDHAVPLEADGA